MVGVMALAQVPMASIANNNDDSTYAEENLRFLEESVTLTLDQKVDDLSSYLDSNLGPFVEWSSSNESVVTVDENGNIKGIKDGTATITAKSIDEWIATKSETIEIRTGSETIKVPTESQIRGKYSAKIKVIVKYSGWSEDNTHYYDVYGEQVKNQFVERDGKTYYFDENGELLKDTTKLIDDYYCTFDKDGVLVEKLKKSAITRESSSSSSGESSGGGSSSSSSSSSVGSNSTSTTSPSGATVVTDVTTGPNGEKITSAKISLGGKTMTVQNTEVTNADGSKVTYTTVSGDPSGLTFNGVGTVSADGLTLAGVDGVTYYVCSAPCYLITMADGSTIGCFLDPATGLPIATGTYMLYFQLGADGQMHAHWVNPAGFFVSGLQTINGITANFNAFGEMIG